MISVIRFAGTRNLSAKAWAVRSRAFSSSAKARPGCTGPKRKPPGGASNTSSAGDIAISFNGSPEFRPHRRHNLEPEDNAPVAARFAPQRWGRDSQLRISPVLSAWLDLFRPRDSGVAARLPWRARARFRIGAARLAYPRNAVRLPAGRDHRVSADRGAELDRAPPASGEATSRPCPDLARGTHCGDHVGLDRLGGCGGRGSRFPSRRRNGGGARDRRGTQLAEPQGADRLAVLFAGNIIFHVEAH